MAAPKLLSFWRSTLPAKIAEAIACVKAGKKPTTQKTIDYVTRHWWITFGNDKLPTKRDACEYIETARARGSTNKTIVRTLGILRQIYTEVGVGNEFDAALKLVRVDHYTPERRHLKAMDRDDVRKLLNAPSGATLAGRRDRAMIALMVGGGLRISETLALKVCDIGQTKQATWYADIQDSKTGKAKRAPIANICAPYISSFLGERVECGTVATTPFLPALRYRASLSTPRDRSNATRDFKAYVAAAGLEGITPHSCRATAITLLLEQGLTYREVQEFSRHRSVKMVELYDKRRWEIDNNPGHKLKF